jgi:bifunctional non-homologous end joining protein LigD
MLARSGRGMPVDLDEWAVEPKWDGWRCLARIEDGEVRLTSRWRHDLTPLFPNITRLPSPLAARRLLLDGEIVALRPDGSEDFHALTRRHARKDTRVAFICFDALHIDGVDLLDETYAARRHELEQLRIKHDHWLTTPSAQGDATSALWTFTFEHRWEGVVAKRLDSRYRPASRSGEWLKAKHPHARDLQVDRSTWRQRDSAAAHEPLIAYS